MTALVHGFVRVQPGSLTTVLTAAARMSEASRAEPGCLSYHCAQDVGDPNTLVLVEEWASDEALQAHLGSPAFAAFVETIRPAVAESPTITRFGDVTGRPLLPRSDS
ncbi:putative quinol monooxygenase [Actinoplanes sp. NPDC049265]|uniref:putative quinol monooxygenase n=1 Tax=Actinoplanes sp. NPDC049265 TaxID=3363902 RepID=UPI0037231489